MILIIDNYDSFVYNLYQFVGAVNPDVRVVRNDEMTVEQIRALKPSHIILSPGPGYPKDAGICEEVALNLGEIAPVLGVCLGHQAICETFGATISHAKQLMHGKQSEIILDDTCPIFNGMPRRIKGARYHSLAARRETIPECLRPVAETEDGEIMAVMHAQYPVYGVQFHPESVLTPDGMQIIRNFLAQRRETCHD